MGSHVGWSGDDFGLLIDTEIVDFGVDMLAAVGLKCGSNAAIRADGQGNSAVFPVNIMALDVEYYRDIKPILERSCVPCHSASGNPAAGLILDDEFKFNGVDNTYNRLANDPGGFFGIPPLTSPFGWNHNNQSRYIRSFQSRRSLLAWKVFGQRLDGWTNADHPSAFVPGNPNTLPGGGSPQEIEKADEIAILIGPEGDFTEEEVTLATEAGFIPVSLGTTRLRTETAALYGIATIKSIKGF